MAAISKAGAKQSARPCVGCGAMISPRSKYYKGGTCFRCERWDSKGGQYRVRYNYRVKGLSTSQHP